MLIPQMINQVFPGMRTKRDTFKTAHFVKNICGLPAKYERDNNNRYQGNKYDLNKGSQFNKCQIKQKVRINKHQKQK